MRGRPPLALRGCACTRRAALGLTAAGLAALAAAPARALDPEHEPFVRAAFAMRSQAVEAGDQPYGAVVVQRAWIVGWGPSRVVSRGGLAGHAEREALRDAQARLATEDLSSCVMYSTSRPCADCERAAAAARLARMYFGPQATNAGPPRPT